MWVNLAPMLCVDEVVNPFALIPCGGVEAVLRHYSEHRVGL